MEMGAARLAFMKKKFAEAAKAYEEIIERHANIAVAAEAIYWRAVCKYKATNDHTVLTPAAVELNEKFPGDEWTLKSDPWLH